LLLLVLFLLLSLLLAAVELGPSGLQKLGKNAD